jgi:hypothetical protein
VIGPMKTFSTFLIFILIFVLLISFLLHSYNSFEIILSTFIKRSLR